MGSIWSNAGVRKGLKYGKTAGVMSGVIDEVSSNS
jgi:hypothetical protein